MMSNFATNTEEMRTKSANIQVTAERIRADINTMQASLHELEGTWQGMASSNFQSVVQQWRATQTQVEESLNSISRALTVSAQHYDDAEQANASMFAF
ncbi:WXG100 family type VII secretion target [Neomicrococcus lactis]